MALESTIAHKSTHAAGAADALTPADIGAVKSYGNPQDENIAPAAMELRDNEDAAVVALKCDGSLSPVDNPWSVTFPDKLRAAIGAAPAADGVPSVARAAMQLWDPANDIPALTISDGEVSVMEGPLGYVAESFRAAIGAASIDQVFARLPLSTSNYIIAQPGDNLADKYNAAKLLQPNGVAKSSSNRAALIILPGTYNLTGTLTFDAEFVDVIGLGSCFQSPAVRLKFQVLQSLSVSANNIRVVGIEVLAELNPANSKPLQVYENCKCIKGFGARGEVSGTFIGCIAGDASFGSTLFSSGARPVASGTYIRCKSGSSSFASGGLASGKFIDCEAGYGSFGGDGSEGDLVGEASGEFINCKAEDFSFGVNGAFLDSPAASGVFTNCSGGLGSFGAYSHASGTFTNCSGGFESFRAGVAAGKYIGCRADSPFSLSAPPSSAVVSYGGVNWISIYSTANPGTKFLGPSNFREGDCVIFSGLVGGAPLQNGVPYYVKNASLNVPASNGYPAGFRFQVSGQQGGSVISMTSNIVFGRVRLLAFQQNCIDINGNIFEGQI